MEVDYKTGIITIVCENKEEQDVCDYIFSRNDGAHLIQFHIESLLNQRKAQRDSDLKDEIFERFQQGKLIEG